MIGFPAAGETSIVLRQPLDTDFDVLAYIRRDPAIQDMLMAIPDATDDEAVKSWIERRRNDGAFRIVADATTREALGFVQVSQIHRRNRHGYGGLALLNSARGHGRGPCYRSTTDETCLRRAGAGKASSGSPGRQSRCTQGLSRSRISGRRYAGKSFSGSRRQRASCPATGEAPGRSAPVAAACCAPRFSDNHRDPGSIG